MPSISYIINNKSVLPKNNYALNKIEQAFTADPQLTMLRQKALSEGDFTIIFLPGVHASWSWDTRTMKLNSELATADIFRDMIFEHCNIINQEMTDIANKADQYNNAEDFSNAVFTSEYKHTLCKSFQLFKDFSKTVEGSRILMEMLLQDVAIDEASKILEQKQNALIPSLDEAFSMESTTHNTVSYKIQWLSWKIPNISEESPVIAKQYLADGLNLALKHNFIQEAIALCNFGIESWSDDPSNYYTKACIISQFGYGENAIDLLKTASKIYEFKGNIEFVKECYSKIVNIASYLDDKESVFYYTQVLASLESKSELYHIAKVVSYKANPITKLIDLYAKDSTSQSDILCKY